jgi:hypothetical protein
MPVWAADGVPLRGIREGRQRASLARIIHECRREAFETEARRGFSHVTDAGVLAVRRGGRTRKATPGERIGRRSRYS